MHLRSGATYVTVDHSCTKSQDTYNQLKSELPLALQQRLPAHPLARTDSSVWVGGKLLVTEAAPEIRARNELWFRKMIKRASVP